MTIQTKILIHEDDDEKVGEYWERFCFDLNKYVAHSEHDFGSVLYLAGMPGAVVVQLTFSELSCELEILNNFERISLN